MRRAWWAGYLHGGVWKIAALIAKAAFVFLIVPRLPDGAFGSYSLVSTITTIAAIVLSFGALEALPTILRGREALLRRVCPLVHFTLLGTVICAAAYPFGGGFAALAAAVVFVNLSYLVLAGILRASRPHGYEILSNAPTLLFLVLCAIFPSPQLDELLWNFVIANFAVTVAIGWSSGLLFWPTKRQIRFAAATAVRLIKTGNGKSLSSILIIADFRALILVPGVIMGKAPADELAVALTVGEALWQLGMVVVNRNYTRYCAGGGSIRATIQSALLLLTALVVAGVLLLIAPIPFSIKRFDWWLIGWAAILFGSFTALTELRSFCWSRRLFEGQILLVQILIIVAQAAIAVLFPASFWLPGAAIFMLLLTLAGTVVIARVNEPKPLRAP